MDAAKPAREVTFVSFGKARTVAEQLYPTGYELRQMAAAISAATRLRLIGCRTCVLDVRIFNLCPQCREVTGGGGRWPDRIGSEVLVLPGGGCGPQLFRGRWLPVPVMAVPSALETTAIPAKDVDDLDDLDAFFYWLASRDTASQEPP